MTTLSKTADAKSVHDWMTKKTDWNKLDKPVYRPQTSDGRQILIVRTCEREKDKNTFVPNTLGIEVYIEKYDQIDDDPTNKSLGRRVMEALFQPQNSTFSSSSSSYKSELTWGDKTLITSENLTINLKSQMTADRANELFAQLA